MKLIDAEALLKTMKEDADKLQDSETKAFIYTAIGFVSGCINRLPDKSVDNRHPCERY